jgi:hypothetical protein
MTASGGDDMLPIFVLAFIAVLFAALSMRLRAPWFVGAPLAGVASIVVFELIGYFVLGESEKFLDIALVFGAIYATGFAMTLYIGRFFLMRLRRIERST